MSRARTLHVKRLHKLDALLTAASGIVSTELRHTIVSLRHAWLLNLALRRASNNQRGRAKA